MMQSIPLIVWTFMLYFMLFSPVFTSKVFNDFRQLNETSIDLKTMKLINAHLKKINKPFVKSIKSSDGDIIDCVLFNLQPAFDLPEIKEKMTLDPPELPKGHDSTKMETEINQLWSSKGESCPNGTIPIRRTTASDVLRSMSVSKFGKKVSTNSFPGARDHEHALGYVKPGEFYGAKAFLNVWKPNVFGQDFSLTQIWVIADFPNRDVQTVEAGWHAYPSIYKDNNPRIFSYWTANSYRSGCYNLRCPGFVQTNTRIALGAAISPVSAYNGKQYDVSFMIWKDTKSGDWWWKVGNELIGYWPQTLFTDLRNHATFIEYGGEVYSHSLGKHTSTQMGSGHFPNERFGKAAYARNLEIIDKDNAIRPVSNLRLLADKPNCYAVTNGYNNVWGNYIYFGGPGNNPNCP